MASARRDDLAKRLAERLEKAPAKGRAMRAGSDDDAAPSARPRRQSDEHPRTRPAAPKRDSPKATATKRNSPKQATGKQASPGPATRRTASSPRTAGGAQSPTQRAATPISRPRRGATGTVLRGHLVPDAIHGDARRRKATLRSQRGGRVTWDDVMFEGLSLLVDRGRRVDATLDQVRHSDAGAARRRLVQATLPAELDHGLVELQLDLGERPDTALTYEQLWTSAVLLWLDATA